MKLIAMAFLALFPLQPPSTLAGTWTAEKDGVTFVRLELRTAGNTVAGALAIGNLGFDETGAPKTVAAAPPTLTPLSDIVIANGVVSFVWKPDSDNDRFRFRVISDTSAELTFLPSEEMLEELKDEGLPAPKPIALRKVR